MRSLLRGAAIVLLTVAAAWLVTAATIGTTLGHANPALARQVWPVAAAPRSALAATQITPGAPASSIASADTLARAAIAREPVDVAAARTLALVAAVRGDGARSNGWLAYAERLSRRDLATQMALIELAVARGDVTGALVHYDRALSTSARAPDILFPVLVPAVNNPAVVEPMARLLARRPDWWYSFTLQLVQQGAAPPNLYRLLAAERLRVDIPVERDVAIAGMKQLAAAQRVDLAAALYERLVPGQRAGARLNNGGFAPVAPIPPFDWDLVAGGNVSASMETLPGRGRVLYLNSPDANDGQVAQQLLRLTPGRYALDWLYGGGAPEGLRARLSVVCLAGQPVIAERVDAGLAEGRARPLGLRFVVPGDCPAQWLRIDVRAGVDPSATSPWIARMTLVRAR